MSSELNSFKQGDFDDFGGQSFSGQETDHLAPLMQVNSRGVEGSLPACSPAHLLSCLSNMHTNEAKHTVPHFLT